MTTPVQEVITLDELADILENEAPCMYRRINKKTMQVTFECDQSASWAGTCRSCGTISLLCEEHCDKLRNNISTPSIWCSHCKLLGSCLADIYVWVHKI